MSQVETNRFRSKSRERPEFFGGNGEEEDKIIFDIPADICDNKTQTEGIICINYKKNMPPNPSGEQPPWQPAASEEERLLREEVEKEMTGTGKIDRFEMLELEDMPVGISPVSDVKPPAPEEAELNPRIKMLEIPSRYLRKRRRENEANRRRVIDAEVQARIGKRRAFAEAAVRQTPSAASPTPSIASVDIPAPAPVARQPEAAPVWTAVSPNEITTPPELELAAYGEFKELFRGQFFGLEAIIAAGSRRDSEGRIWQFFRYSDEERRNLARAVEQFTGAPRMFRASSRG